MLRSDLYNATTAYSRKLSRIQHPGIVQNTPFLDPQVIEFDVLHDSLLLHTLNLHRFPYSAIASQYLCSYLLEFKPDVCFFQEVKNLHQFVPAINFFNSLCVDTRYLIYYSAGRVWRSFNCFLVRSDISVDYNFLLHYPPAYYTPPFVLRPPVIFNFYFNEHLLHFFNLHGVPFGARDVVSKREKFFNLVLYYIQNLPAHSFAVIGGDFNYNFKHITDYLESYVYQPEFTTDYNGIDYFLLNSEATEEEFYSGCGEIDLESTIKSDPNFPDWNTDFSDHYPIEFILDFNF